MDVSLVYLFRLCKTSLGDECLGCQRGFSHFCNVLKRHVPAVLPRARLQPPLSSLMATRVGLGLQEVAPEESQQASLEQAKTARKVFSVRELPAMSSARAMPVIPYEPLTDPRHRGDGTFWILCLFCLFDSTWSGSLPYIKMICFPFADVVRFIEEVVHMKVPEPHRSATPTSNNPAAAQQLAAASSSAPVRTSRAALLMRKTAKLPTNNNNEPTELFEDDEEEGDTVEMVLSLYDIFTGREKGQDFEWTGETLAIFRLLLVLGALLLQVALGAADVIYASERVAEAASILEVSLRGSSRPNLPANNAGALLCKAFGDRARNHPARIRFGWFHLTSEWKLGVCLVVVSIWLAIAGIELPIGE